MENLNWQLSKRAPSILPENSTGKNTLTKLSQIHNYFKNSSNPQNSTTHWSWFHRWTNNYKKKFQTFFSLTWKFRNKTRNSKGNNNSQSSQKSTFFKWLALLLNSSNTNETIKPFFMNKAIMSNTKGPCPLKIRSRIKWKKDRL